MLAALVASSTRGRPCASAAARPPCLRGAHPRGRHEHRLALSKGSVHESEEAAEELGEVGWVARDMRVPRDVEPKVGRRALLPLAKVGHIVRAVHLGDVEAEMARIVNMDAAINKVDVQALSRFLALDRESINAFKTRW